MGKSFEFGINHIKLLLYKKYTKIQNTPKMTKTIRQNPQFERKMSKLNLVYLEIDQRRIVIQK
jgi:hypothetical protein